MQINDLFGPCKQTTCILNCYQLLYSVCGMKGHVSALYAVTLRENGRAETNLSKSFISQFEWASECAACVNVYLTDPTSIWIPVYAKRAVPLNADGCICMRSFVQLS